MRTRRGVGLLAAATALLLMTACSSGDTPAVSTTVSVSRMPSSGAEMSSSTADASSSASGTAASGTAASATTSTGASIVPEVLTPVLAVVPDDPVPVTGTDGTVYLAYELHLTNITSTPVTIDSIQAVDADGGAVVQEYSGADLVAHSGVVGATTASDTVTLGAGQLGLFWLDPSADSRQLLPTALDHVVTMTFAEPPNPLVPADFTETVARTTVSTVPAPVIAPPLTGDNWLNGNGCCDTITPHRAAVNPINGRYDVAERFAIDWVQLDASGRIFTGDITKLESYPYYGDPIFAVSDGEVVAVSDELPDEPPGENPPAGALQVTQYGANYVVERFSQGGHDYYAFYAHLKPGTASASVKVGQQIKTGDEIGELGNSGNTDGPHLHFHVMDGPNPLASNGLPYEFDAMTMVGRGASSEALDAAVKGAPLELKSGGPTGTRTDALPLWMDVVNLTAGR